MLEIREKDPLLKAGEGGSKTIKMLIAEEKKVVTDQWQKKGVPQLKLI
jgi:hypothetical protein